MANSPLSYARTPDGAIDYGKIKLGVKTLEDAVLNLGDLPKAQSLRLTKAIVLKALATKDVKLIRTISNQFYDMSGIYERACNYFAFLYRYDWYVIPEVYDENGGKVEKIVKEYTKILAYLDNSYIKKLCGDIALKVVKNGCYYGYLVPTDDSIIFQELPANYCRTRGSVKGSPIVEFNMAYFDEKFPDLQYRLKVLKLFPEEFQKGYVLYRKNKINLEDFDEEDKSICGFTGYKSNGWYVLDPESTVKFNLNGSDIPVFASAIPDIFDLDAAQDLDRRKQMQQLLKIIVQKLPLDKNGDLIFDIDEARDIHNNTVQMLQRCIGVDVMTTFADVMSINTSDRNTTATQDDLAKSERTVFNSLGISKNLFNTDGNMALEKSILTDESTMRDLLLQFTIFFDKIIQKKNSNRKKYAFRFYMLETTQYNYKELAKMYKEQVQNGYSKMLPHIAMGHPQSSILNTAYFENEVLKLPYMMLPPLMSSTMSIEELLAILGKDNQSSSQNTTEEKNIQQKKTSQNGEAGRPEKPDDQKSEKTIQNRESMS